jgi:hypothetical protein
MQKHMFGVMCPDALFMESVPIPHEHQNSALMLQVSFASVSLGVLASSGISTAS